MPDNASQTRTEPQEGPARRALPVLVFVAVMAVALGLAGWSIRRNAAERRVLMERRVDTLRLTLSSVLRSYLDILPGLRLAASGPTPVTDAEFQRYADTVLSPDRFPGLAITFIAEGVDDAQRGDYVARVAADHSLAPDRHPDFDIRPPGRRPRYMVLRHQSPRDPPTEGYDLFDPGQRYRAAVEQAIDEGRLVATGPLQLARDRDQPRRPELTSIVVRAATYRGANLPANVAERRQLATGVVGIGFRTTEVVRSALPAELLSGHRVRVTDPQAPPDAAPLYDDGVQTDDASGTLGFMLPVGNRRWHVEVTPSPRPWWRDADAGTLTLLAAGLVSALSLSTLTGGLSRARRKAEASVRDGVVRLEQEKTQLARSETRLRMLFENSFDAVLNTRPDGSVLAANPAACALFGRTEAELCALGRDGVVDIGDPRLIRLLELRNTHGRARGSVRMRRADGTLFEAEISSMSYRDVDGSPLASLIVRDLSQQLAAAAERERLETQLRHAQKMEAVGTLAGGIAHDFNNMLAVVLGGATLLDDELGPDHAARPQLERMRQASLRGRSLVQQLLTFSRPSAEGRRAQRLQPLVQEALSLLSVTLPASVRLESRFTAEPLTLLTEATQIQQIVINLCTNAWQAMPGHKGRIEVTLDASTDAGRPWARLSVQDDGAGMDAATRDRIFEPFFTTKASGHGTGLGLAMVHGIVTGHGGRIDVTSAPGAGTRFDVWLPLSTDMPADAEPPRASPAEVRGLGQRVLYLDDDEVLRLTIEALLNRQGYLAEPQAEPAAALAAIAAAPQSVALLVTDFNMPQMSGLEVALAAQRLRADLPVLIVSGHITDELRSAVLPLPHVRLMRKEQVVEQLAELVAGMLAEQPQARQEVR